MLKELIREALEELLFEKSEEVNVLDEFPIEINIDDFAQKLDELGLEYEIKGEAIFVKLNSEEDHEKLMAASEEYLDSITEEELEEAKKGVRIKVKHPGILEVPEGKNVMDLPLEHFIKLAKKKGYAAIIRALNNLQVWNKNRNKKLANWAKKMKEQLRKAREEGKI